MCVCVRTRHVHKEQRGGEPKSPRDTPGTNCSLRRETKRVVGAVLAPKALQPQGLGGGQGRPSKDSTVTYKKGQDRPREHLNQ